MQEQRVTLRLLRYWELIRKNKRFPDIAHFNSAVIEEIWPYCFKIGIQNRGSLAYKYEYMGQPIIELYGRDLTGMVVEQNVKEFPGSVIHKKLQEVVTSQEPLQDENHLVNSRGQMIKYRACLLPFGTEKNGLTHIVVGLSCRQF